jgi:hypothetical protein
MFWVGEESLHSSPFFGGRVGSLGFHIVRR